MVRLGLYALGLMLALSPLAGWGQGRAHAENAATSQPNVFDPAARMPATGSAEAEIRAAALSGHSSHACAQALAALATAQEPILSRLRWQVAHQCDASAARDAARAALMSSSHPLSLWMRLDAADSVRATDPGAALAWLPDDTTSWAGRDRARVVRALALAQRGDASAEAALRALVSAAAPESGAATVAMPLAELLHARDTLESKLEALSLLRRVASRAPLTSVGRQALAQSVALLATLPAEMQAQYALPSIDDEQHRARALFQAHRHGEAADVYAALAQRVREDAGARCAALVSQLRALSRVRERRAELVSLADQVSAECAEPESRAWSHYYAAQALARMGDAAGAAQRFDRVGSEAPGHSLVDDALFKGAQSALDAGDLAGSDARLSVIVEQHPRGDMVGMARFERAWRMRKAGDHAGALAELEQLLGMPGHETSEGLEGRTAYWRARCLQALGRTDEAIAALRTLIVSAPLSYYGQQALERVRELRPALAADLGVAIAVQPDTSLRFEWRPELTEPAFQRAVELLAVGDVDRARQEFEWMGAFGEGADPELLWMIAALFDAANAPAQASRIARDRLRGFMAVAPQGRGYALWRIGFPRAFSPVIDDAAREHEVPAAFVRAVAREESAFDPQAVSSAGAYGLIQLMEATARQHAQGLKLPSDPNALRRPEVNVRIGASFMRYLWKRYADNPAVVPAAYNAGHGAADRWLRERNTLSLDEWIEAIPYDETRRYSRRVLQSFGVYALLDEGRLPALNATLPSPRIR